MAEMLHHLQSFPVNCMPPILPGLTVQDFLLFLTPILSTSLMQKFTSILSLSALSLAFSGKSYNSLPASVFSLSYFMNSLKREVSRSCICG